MSNLGPENISIAICHNSFQNIFLISPYTLFNVFLMYSERVKFLSLNKDNILIFMFTCFNNIFVKIFSTMVFVFISPFFVAIKSTFLDIVFGVILFGISAMALVHLYQTPPKKKTSKINIISTNSKKDSREKSTFLVFKDKSSMLIIFCLFLIGVTSLWLLSHSLTLAEGPLSVQADLKFMMVAFLNGTFLAALIKKGSKNSKSFWNDENLKGCVIIISALIFCLTLNSQLEGHWKFSLLSFGYGILNTVHWDNFIHWIVFLVIMVLAYYVIFEGTVFMTFFETWGIAGLFRKALVLSSASSSSD